MAEYIEREAVKKTLHDSTTEMEQSIGYSSNVGVPEEDINYVIDEIPSADVVEVVRCKDCEYAKEYKNNLFCCYYPRAPKSVSSNDYCSYGERKDGD